MGTKSSFNVKVVDTDNLKRIKRLLKAELASAEREGLSTSETAATISAINAELRGRSVRRHARAAKSNE